MMMSTLYTPDNPYDIPYDIPYIHIISPPMDYLGYLDYKPRNLSENAHPSGTAVRIVNDRVLLKDGKFTGGTATGKGSMGVIPQDTDFIMIIMHVNGLYI